MSNKANFVMQAFKLWPVNDLIKRKENSLEVEEDKMALLASRHSSNVATTWTTICLLSKIHQGYRHRYFIWNLMCLRNEFVKTLFYLFLR
jgi:hypothetical protein